MAVEDGAQPVKILAADLSLRRPGFAILQADPARLEIDVLSMLAVDSRNVKTGHGSILERIYQKVLELAPMADVFVREGCYTNRKTQSQVLYKVHGVSDLALWQTCQGKFEEIPATLVKKLVAGNGKASKEEVAAALEQFVGPQAYDCDDMSDAVAVGVSWLLMNGGQKKKNGLHEGRCKP